MVGEERVPLILQQSVRADLALGVKRKLSGTPTFFVNGEMIVGLRPLEFWVNKISELIQKQ